MTSMQEDALVDRIDHATIPWGWFLSFFIASFATLGRPSRRTAVTALILAFLLTLQVWNYTEATLTPIFDPYF